MQIIRYISIEDGARGEGRRDKVSYDVSHGMSGLLLPNFALTYTVVRAGGNGGEVMLSHYKYYLDFPRYATLSTVSQPSEA